MVLNARELSENREHYNFNVPPAPSTFAYMSDSDYDPDDGYEAEPDDYEPAEYELHSWNHVPWPLLFKADGDVRGINDGRADRYPSAPDREPYLGLEIEVECYACSASQLIEPWDTRNLGWVGSDGSLSDGVEAKTYPTTYSRLESDGHLAAALRDMKNAGGRAWRTQTCGLHIHISRKAFKSIAHQWRFLTAQEEMLSICQTLAGRGSVQYSTWPGDPDDPDHIYPDHLKASRVLRHETTQSERYVALNLQNASTIELRYWRGSLAEHHVMGACAFVDALYRWTGALTLKTMPRGGGDAMWAKFTAWCSDNLSDVQTGRIMTLASKRGVDWPGRLTLTDTSEMVDA